MPLKTRVKVGNISNLSDARYCAGMGVDMLGFQVIEGQENYIGPATYHEIRGWVSGPSVVVELYGINSDTNLPSIIENFAPDFLEINLPDLPFIDGISLPVILSLNEKLMVSDGHKISAAKEKIAFVLIKESANSIEFMVEISNQFPVLITIESPTRLSFILENLKAKGIALNGSKEIKTGLKDYDNLADVLEQLEVD